MAERAGIVGLGNIGLAIARRCEAMGLAIGYSGRNPKPGVGYAYFPDPVALAEWSDILIVATPGGAGTAGLISAAVLEALGPAGTLVNVARGSVVDEGSATRPGRSPRPIGPQLRGDGTLPLISLATQEWGT